jgi:RHH-type proline utilization regulon transcriptional repressor/proline dehydrogenase/delta 1-pyrroline-5-carboxylate dehydrogenase
VKHGEPLLRKGVEMAMRLMAEQFVIGETSARRCRRCKREAKGFLYSFDMLGEAAMTAAGCRTLSRGLRAAIDAIGAAAQERGIYIGPGISIKLSALHPRYSRSHRARVMAELYPRLLALTLRARHHDIGLNIDAEEAERLELSLDLFERLCSSPRSPAGTASASSRRRTRSAVPFVIDYLATSRADRRRLMVRLVKGAYWDSEIKRAQVDGHGRLSGLYAQGLHRRFVSRVRAQDARAPDALYPQFATHNAHTAGGDLSPRGPDYYPGQYEFQCLHGMGEPLYEHVVGSPTKESSRALPHLRAGRNAADAARLSRSPPARERRQHLFRQPDLGSVGAVQELVSDPVAGGGKLQQREGVMGLPHPRIPLPRALFGDTRVNSMGLDLC